MILIPELNQLKVLRTNIIYDYGNNIMEICLQALFIIPSNQFLVLVYTAIPNGGIISADSSNDSRNLKRLQTCKNLNQNIKNAFSIDYIRFLFHGLKILVENPCIKAN